MSNIPLREKPALYDTTLADLEQMMHEWQLPIYRARQVYRHLYVQLTSDIERMTDLPTALRQYMQQACIPSLLHLDHIYATDNGLTRKAVFQLHDGIYIESVLMFYNDRTTVCVSTQAGCAIGCVFCATGQMGLHRNLSSGEIIEQVIWAANEVQQSQQANANSPSLPFNIVFMGMGEPFANYDAWWRAVERLHDPKGFHLGARRMTVSTVGLVPGIQRLATESLPINLAISLHAPDDQLRNRLIPINERYPIDDVLNAAQAYINQTKRRVSLEYVLLNGQNDDPSLAKLLAQRLHSITPRKQTMLFHVNLIPWNPVPAMPLDPSRRKRVLEFQQVLQEQHVACTVRVERGLDIAAACGQLAGKRTPYVHGEDV